MNNTKCLLDIKDKYLEELKKLTTIRDVVHLLNSFVRECGDVDHEFSVEEPSSAICSYWRGIGTFVDCHGIYARCIDEDSGHEHKYQGALCPFSYWFWIGRGKRYDPHNDIGVGVMKDLKFRVKYFIRGFTYVDMNTSDIAFPIRANGKANYEDAVAIGFNSDWADDLICYHW